MAKTDEEELQKQWRVLCLWIEKGYHWCHQEDHEHLDQARRRFQAHRFQHSADPSAVVDLLVCEPGATPKSMLAGAEHGGERAARSHDTVQRLAADLKGERS